MLPKIGEVATRTFACHIITLTNLRVFSCKRGSKLSHHLVPNLVAKHFKLSNFHVKSWNPRSRFTVDQPAYMFCKRFKGEGCDS